MGVAAVVAAVVAVVAVMVILTMGLVVVITATVAGEAIDGNCSLIGLPIIIGTLWLSRQTWCPFRASYSYSAVPDGGRVHSVQ